MKTFNKNSSKSNAQSATERAQSANTFAKEARTYRDNRNMVENNLQEWERIMIDSPIILFSIAFFFFAGLEIIVSWTMYGDLQSSIFDKPKAYLSILIGLSIVTLGAVVSHYIAKKLSGSLSELAVFNLRNRTNFNIPLTVAEEKVRAKTRKHLNTGIVFFLLLLSLVFGISFQRVALMGAINGESYGWFQRLLPVGIVILEVFCGIYLSYFFKRSIMNMHINKLNKQFEKLKLICAYETRLCNDLYEQASNQDEHLSYNRELHDTIYRYTNRTQDNDNYVDEIPESKTIKVMVISKGKAVSGAYLCGILPDNGFTNAIWTNDSGQAVLEWEGESDFVTAIMVENIEHHGPFHANSNVKIDINRPGMIKAA